MNRKAYMIFVFLSSFFYQNIICQTSTIENFHNSKLFTDDLLTSTNLEFENETKLTFSSTPNINISNKEVLMTNYTTDVLTLSFKNSYQNNLNVHYYLINHFDSSSISSSSYSNSSESGIIIGSFFIGALLGSGIGYLLGLMGTHAGQDGEILPWVIAGGVAGGLGFALFFSL